ncbi:CPBP family intramembrane metalloprotease [Massilia arenosa]|uniref:CPBP family intramembrane metalloprotease n=1 Tax=Zemynaea arenosa TaxID=2561931 RepID=A0A4Y9RNP3_9BURK|nr:type II CAAX endopeptidase family protein [Massilia arenosa]TFW10644.1 CPBP family intramembrane metalloprotease [Massilia arenosa]
MNTAVDVQALRPSVAKRIFKSTPIRIVLAALVVMLATFVPIAVIHSWVPKMYRPLWPELVSATVALLVYRFYTRRTEKRDVTELAAPRALPELAAGFGVGFVLVCAVLAVQALLGVYHLERMNPMSFAVIKPLGEMVFVGTLEELLFRAILFRMLATAWGTLPALIVSSLLFGLAHVPGASPTLLALGVIVVASLMLSAAYLRTRRVWLCIGIHVGWNYTLGTIWSIAVSGHEVKEGLFTGQLTGPDWLTGGVYGLEGSVVSLVVLIIATIALMRRARFAWA